MARTRSRLVWYAITNRRALNTFWSTLVWLIRRSATSCLPRCPTSSSGRTGKTNRLFQARTSRPKRVRPPRTEPASDAEHISIQKKSLRRIRYLFACPCASPCSLIYPDPQSAETHILMKAFLYEVWSRGFLIKPFKWRPFNFHIPILFYYRTSAFGRARSVARSSAMATRSRSIARCARRCRASRSSAATSARSSTKPRTTSTATTRSTTNRSWRRSSQTLIQVRIICLRLQILNTCLLILTC